MLTFSTGAMPNSCSQGSAKTCSLASEAVTAQMKRMTFTSLRSHLNRYPDISHVSLFDPLNSIRLGAFEDRFRSQNWEFQTVEIWCRATVWNLDMQLEPLSSQSLGLVSSYSPVPSIWSVAKTHWLWLMAGKCVLFQRARAMTCRPGYRSSDQWKREQSIEVTPERIIWTILHRPIFSDDQIQIFDAAMATLWQL